MTKPATWATIKKDPKWVARLLKWYETEYPKYLARKATA